MLLEELSRLTPVMLVSGRSLPDLRNMIGLRSIGYIGNHGLEMHWQERHWVHPGFPHLAATMRSLVGSAIKAIADIPGVWLEDKQMTATLHFRQASAANAALAYSRLELLTMPHQQEVELRFGKKVFELRPRLDWHKGKAVLLASEWLGFSTDAGIIYIGDDDTDEDAFQELGRTANAYTFLVGSGRESLAGHRLSGVPAVWGFLERLLRVLGTGVPATRP